MKEGICYWRSPIGTLTVTGNERAVTGLFYNCSLSSFEENLPSLVQARQWLEAYFDGEKQPIPPVEFCFGTAFSRTVWQALLTIPYGEWVSYGEIARRIGSPDAVRAVGTAVGHNPIGILVPCHRVLRADGTIGGYAGGVDKKEYLLNLEHIPFAK